ncbi:MAG TPA: hypothetical protein EYG38_09255, partial [Verrucomicrobia bacterium]|nr:hypothetical protein [Verrucomicrobiota bacterium]
TLYFYQVRNKVGEINAVSPIYSFKTLKHSGPVRFMVFGDSGHGTQGQYKIAEVIQQNDPELVFHTGDTVYPSLTGFRADTRCLSVYHDHMIRTPYFYAMGNHDLNGGDDQFLTTFYTPANPFTNTPHFYSVDHGDVHFSVLLAPFLSQFGTDKLPNYSLLEGGIQNQWLDWDLEQTDKPWKVIIMHHPIQTSGNHRFTDSNFNQIADWVEVRQALLPLVSKHGVQLILNGHDHVYERFAPVQGVHTVTTGAGGGNLYQLTQRATGSMQFQARYNCVRVQVSGETLQLEALSDNGEVFDTMSITRSMIAPPQLVTGTWNSPRVESSRVDDGFGNIPGQKFDFFSKPIEAVAGKNSNLGRAYVNNDRTHVYIGLKQAMFYSVDSIYLFIETPTIPGRESMLQTGNDLIDPLGQGGDGLDFLETLDFLNFKPSIGCILGDESMDGTAANFQRQASDLNTGHGGFYIRRNLTEIPGFRLQQFNRSPQLVPFPFEENADLIELAIPYSSLGNLLPGSRIKIGAITARYELGDAENALPTPHIDTGYLGKSLKKNSRTGRWLLEPFTIQLAADPALESLDSDTDSLTDIWEISFGLNPFNKEGDQGGKGDPDKDGVGNFEEQFAGTDPTDRNSLLKLHAAMIEGNSVRLDWDTVPGKRYSLEASSFSNREFSVISSDQFPITADSDHYSFTDSLNSELPRPTHKYYRLRVLSSL